MNDNTQTKDISPDLLRKYAECQTNDMETEQVEQWIKSSEENLILARKAYMIVQGTKTLLYLQDTHTAALSSVNKKIGRNSYNIYLKTFQKIAAILLLPLLFFTIFSLHNKYTTPDTWIQVKMASGMVGNIVLPDNSKVWLNSNTSIKYPTRFSKSNREVFINGEAYFSVTKDPDHRFIVHTLNDKVNIEVFGTEFNVDAYDYNNTISTTLVSGSVKLSYLTKKNKRMEHLMTPSEKVVYSKKSYSITTKNVEPKYDTMWREGEILLNNTSLKETLWILSKKYNVDFVIANKSLETSSFTGMFKEQRIEEILEYMHIASGINSRIERDSTNGISRRKIILY